MADACRFCKVPLDRQTRHCQNPHCDWCLACVRKKHEESQRDG